MLDGQFLEPGRLHRGWRPHHQILGLLVHGKADDLADIGLVGKQHDNAIDTRRRAALTAARDADRGRDVLAEWEERLAFEQKYLGEWDETAMRTMSIVTLFRRLDTPSRLVAA